MPWGAIDRSLNDGERPLGELPKAWQSGHIRADIDATRASIRR
jgi:hypothetical protein